MCPADGALWTAGRLLAPKFLLEFFEFLAAFSRRLMAVLRDLQKRLAARFALTIFLFQRPGHSLAGRTKGKCLMAESRLFLGLRLPTAINDIEAPGAECGDHEDTD